MLLNCVHLSTSYQLQPNDDFDKFCVMCACIYGSHNANSVYKDACQAIFTP